MYTVARHHLPAGVLAGLAVVVALTPPAAGVQEPAAAADLPDVTISDAQKQAAAAAYLGRGYSLEKTFASGDSCSGRIFDLKDSDGKDCYELKDVPEYSERVYTGDSVTSYTNEFSTQGGAEFPVYGAAVELKANFSSKITRQHNHRFTTVIQNLTYTRATLLPAAKVSPAAQRDIDTLPPQTLFKAYGTHYTRSLRFGASLTLFTMVDKSLAKNATEAGLAVKATLAKKTGKGGGKGSKGSKGGKGKEDGKGGAGGSLEVNNKYEDLERQMMSSATVRVVGGDPGKALLVRTDTKAGYDEWTRGIPKNLNLSGLDVANDLGLVADLASTQARKDLLTAEAKKYLEAFELDDGFSPVVTKTQEFVLENQNGKFVGKNYGGASYYNPSLKLQRGDAEPVLVYGAAAEVLKSDKYVQIRTNNTSDWTSNWKTYNILGTFGDGVYYYNVEDARANWRFELVGRPGSHSIHFGDKVRLYNESHKQYLYPHANGKYPWTKAGRAKDGDGDALRNDDTVWVIRQKP